MKTLLRHILACNDAVLPGGRVPFRVGAAPVGWLAPEFAAALLTLAGPRRDDGAIVLDDPNALPALGAAAAGLGYGRVRREAFDVRATPTGPVVSTIDRGALPVFGIAAQGVHLDGLVRRADGLHVWIGKRAADKALDPGKLDHIVAGGIPAGLSPGETLVKEAAEEAAIPAELLASACHYATLSYAMARPEGLRRDVLHCYEVDLPEGFTPSPADGEVEGFALWPLQDALAAVRTSDQFKFNVNVVLIALCLRHGLIAGDEANQIRAAMPWALG